jgi:hypothetical protein
MPDVASIARAIDAALPDLARDVVRRHLDLSDQANRAFLQTPDDREQHQTRWHQWGIITHTRRFLELFGTDLPCLLRQWGLHQAVESRLAGQIDRACKRDLLYISILLHDIGKFGARTRGRERFHFTHHEQLSGAIIRNELRLDRFGLTQAQIEYIALTAQDHFVLGLVRKQIRERRSYDSAFIQGREFAEIASGVVRDHPTDYVEVGVLFLGDSLAKATPGEGPELALSQYDINLEVARRYLTLAVGEPPL